MILPVYLYGHPILRKVANDISPDYPHLSALIDNMFETMYNADGVGLAAPQVGLGDRIVVIDLTPLAEDHPECENFKRVFINAHILEESDDTVVLEEGCLSLPGINEKITRSNWVRLQYLDENLQPHEDVFEGFPARCIQHEYDHLEGRVFTDHASGMRKQMISSKLNRIRDGRVNCNYKVKRH
ncbi:MAG: peptide deformylase [Candidatus Symbiothrix sp.]|jgi:peptide deformylase|nr:peptide deformylase [Candidatus Symbiothrix sp.]